MNSSEFIIIKEADAQSREKREKESKSSDAGKQLLQPVLAQRLSVVLTGRERHVRPGGWRSR